jgi:hypothetical protein
MVPVYGREHLRLVGDERGGEIERRFGHAQPR